MEDQDTSGSGGAEGPTGGVLVGDRSGGGKGVLISDALLFEEGVGPGDGVLIGDRTGVLISDRTGVLISDAPFAGAPVVPDLFF